MQNGMDNKLKQRLLGVSVLVMLAVIIVPELVREPAHETEPVVVEPAPSPQADVQNEVTTISLSEPETPPAALAVANPSPALPEVSGESPSVADGETTFPMILETPPSEQIDTIPASPEPTPETRLEAPPEPESKLEPESELEAGLDRIPEQKPEQQPEQKPEQQPEQKPAKKTPPKPSTTAKTQTRSDSLPPIALVSRVGVEAANETARTPRPTQSRRRWMVQAGSFSMMENANRLKTRLRSQGFNAMVQRTMIADRTLYRVRIGPQASRDQSESVRNQLERNTGIRGNVIRSGG